MTMRAAFSRLRPSRPLLIAALLACVGLAPVRAAAPPAPEISAQTAAQLGDLRELTESKNYTVALLLLDRLIAEVPPDSYDNFVLNQVKGQILLTQNRYADAIAPLEAALRHADTHPPADPRVRLDLLYLLAQASAQLAVGGSTAPQAHYDRAYAFIRRWLDLAPVPTTEAQLFAASILYNRAQSATPPVPGQFAAALAESEKGLALAVRPHEQFHFLALAALQQLGEHARAAELIELLLARQPDNAPWWQQLAALYLNLAADNRDARAARRLQLRAVLAIERAQARGFLKTPADQFNLAGLYYNLGQFDRVIPLLEVALAGPLATERRGWDLLANAHQQARQPARAIAVLEQAVARFPTDGRLAYSLAQLCYGDGRLAPARAHAETALSHGGLESRGQTLLFLAHLSYELRELDVAERWLEQAAGQPGVSAGDLVRLRRALDTARPAASRPPS
jgi:tetratricopeptide (TPR) repeat protein